VWVGFLEGFYEWINGLFVFPESPVGKIYSGSLAETGDENSKGEES
jgi:hypothetical protein